MDAKSYCDTIHNQLTGWKASIYDMILSMETMKEEDRKKIKPQIDALNQIVMELNRNLAELRDQCPADWAPQKQDIETKFEKMKQNLEKVSEKIDSIIADSTAWV